MQGAINLNLRGPLKLKSGGSLIKVLVTRHLSSGKISRFNKQVSKNHNLKQLEFTLYRASPSSHNSTTFPIGFISYQLATVQISFKDQVNSGRSRQVTKAPKSAWCVS